MDSTIDILSSNLITNYLIFKKIAGNREVFAVVKGNAYGFGIREVVSILSNVVDGFCVEDTQELLEVRKESRKRCLVLGHAELNKLLPEQIPQTEFALYTWEQIPEFENFAKKINAPIKVHIKIDAKMGRLGFLPEDITLLINILRNSTFIQTVGVFGHLSTAKSQGTDHLSEQTKIFSEAVDLLQAGLQIPLMRHLDATGGLCYREVGGRFEMVRLGAGLYGIWPHKNELLRKPEMKSVTFAMRWRTYIMQVKQVPRGWPIGYDCTYIADKPTKIAVMPQGYADGVDRQLSNSGFVLINEMRCPIIGRISMNMMVADVSLISSVHTGDEVVLLGNQGKNTILPDELATLAQTNEYEIVTRISPLLPRVLVK